jgi:hypothetical protein
MAIAWDDCRYYGAKLNLREWAHSGLPVHPSLTWEEKLRSIFYP